MRWARVAGKDSLARSLDVEKSTRMLLKRVAVWLRNSGRDSRHRTAYHLVRTTLTSSSSRLRRSSTQPGDALEILHVQTYRRLVLSHGRNPLLHIRMLRICQKLTSRSSGLTEILSRPTK